MGEPNYISTDLIASILKRLPSKTLIKFLTVSKSWYSLITSPNFISLHLNHHYSLSLLRPNHHLFLHEFPSAYSFLHFNTLFVRRTFLPHPPSEFSSVAASLNGLICLFNSTQRSLILWNPSINRFKHIDPPPFTHGPSFDAFAVVGLGFDPLLDDYKLVVIDFSMMFVWGAVSLSPPETPPYAQVYSVNNSGWSSVLLPCSFPSYDLSRISDACFVNKVTHWIVFRGQVGPMNANGPIVIELGVSILTFDPRDDCFGEMQLPSVMNNVVDPQLCLAAIDETLTVLHLTGGEDSGWEYSAVVWKMQEYGEAVSWKIMFQIKLPGMYRKNTSLWDNEDGKVLITTSLGTLIVFNVKSGNSSVFQGEVAMMGVQAFSYTESLVLLDKFGVASWLQREQLQVEMQGTE